MEMIADGVSVVPSVLSQAAHPSHTTPTTPAMTSKASAESGDWPEGRRKPSISMRLPPASRGGVEGGRLSLPREDSKPVAMPTERRMSRRNSTMLSILSQTSQGKKPIIKGWNIRPGFEAIKKLRKMVRIIMVFLKWIKALREEAEKDGGGGHDFADIASNKLVSALQTTDGDSFDLKEYVTKKEITLSSEVRSILTLHPSLRAPEQVQTALYGLQLLRSFAEYPVHMQEKLAKVAYFQVVPAKRVIIRQGHEAENFYFVLSGYASVTTLEKSSNSGESTLKHLQYLRKGNSFGELALLHHERRTSTVVSQEEMHLLTIGRNDFFRIFMQATDGSDVPEHIRFVSTLEIMKAVSINHLIENPDMCLFQFFRRGDVIVKDSCTSEWIYIIKNGTCQVLRKLEGIAVKRKPSENEYEDSSLVLPKLGIGEQASRTDTGLIKRAPLLINIMKKRAQLSSRLTIKEKDYLAAEDDALPLLEKERSIDKNPHLALLEKESTSLINVPLVPTTPHMKTTKNEGFTKSKFRLPERSADKPDTYMLPTSEFEALTTCARQPVKKASSVKISIDPIPEEHGFHTVSNDDNQTNLLRGTRTENTRLELPQVELPLRSASTGVRFVREPQRSTCMAHDERPPVYIQVDLLKPRDIFGLMDIKFGEYLENTGINVSLVSKGVECVMINKKFFIDHVSDKVKYMVLQSVRPYPDVKALKENFQIKESWDAYRTNIFTKAAQAVQQSKVSRKSI